MADQVEFCSLCNFITDDHHIFIFHQKSHNRPGVYTCEICKYATNKKSSMFIHKTLDHRIWEPPDLEGLSVITAVPLKKQLKTEDLLQCKFCDFVSNSHGLKIHCTKKHDQPTGYD